MTAPTIKQDRRRFLHRLTVGDGCWEMGGYLTKLGYGQFFAQKTWFQAHRYSYLAFVGPIPDGLQLDHLCRNPSCVCPEHLEAVTGRVNTLRGIGPAAVNAAKTHCKRGHELTAENTYSDPRHRACRICSLEKGERRRSPLTCPQCGRTRNVISQTTDDPMRNCIRCASRIKALERKPPPELTHCKRGHPFDESNTRTTHRGGRSRRVCRACDAHRQHAYQLRKALP